MNTLRRFLTQYPLLSIILLISAVYLPFINETMLRTTGDEKTYIAQALEMQRDGHWFVQTWADQNDYYKGPLHLILLRVGYMIFGHAQMFATLYMNFFGLLIIAAMLQKMYKKLFPDQSGWDVLYAGGFSISIGLYSHMFASQMEVELILFYAGVLYLLQKTSPDKSTLQTHLLLWGSIGLAGWLKSPLHSVLLGLSVFMFWTLQGHIKFWLKDKRFWTSFIFGVVIGIMGYLPIYILDGDTWWNNYIVKESLQKGSNGVPVTDSIFPVLSYYLAPLMFPAILSFLLGLSSFFNKTLPALTSKEKNLIKLAISITFPTMLFFSIHPYRSEIYVLPAVSATWLIAVVLWQKYYQRFKIAYSSSIGLSAIVLALIPLALIYFETLPIILPIWWPLSILILSIVALLSLLYLAFFESRYYDKHSPAFLVFGFVPLFWLIGTLFQVLGNFEMKDVREYLQNNHIERPIAYYNLNHNVWSEYGSLNFWLPHKVVGIHNKKNLLAWLEAGDILLVPGDVYLNKLQDILKHEKSQMRLEITPWRRWMTHGKDPVTGESRFNAYIKSGDLSYIQFHFYIVKKQ